MTLEQRLKVTSFFAATKVLRETCAEECHLCNHKTQIMEPPVIEAVKQLIGFKTVAIVIYSDLRLLGQDDRDTRFNALGHKLRRALEQALEPSTEQSLEVKGMEELIRYDFALVFHPRGYLSKKP